MGIIAVVIIVIITFFQCVFVYCTTCDRRVKIAHETDCCKHTDLVAWRLGLLSTVAAAEAEAECLAPGSTKAFALAKHFKVNLFDSVPLADYSSRISKIQTSVVLAAADDDDAEQSQSQGVMIARFGKREKDQPFGHCNIRSTTVIRTNLDSFAFTEKYY